MATILCVDDEPGALQVFRMALERQEHRVVAVTNADAALAVIGRGGVDLIISDYQMPGMSGIDLVERLRGDGLTIPVIMVTGHGSIEHAVSAMKAGAVDYITKPLGTQQLQLAVEQALEYDRLRRQNAQLREELRQLRGERAIIGESDALKRVLDVVRAVAPTRSTVLIQGESGTGKELVARALHELGDRAEEAFVSVNCAALPATLIESTLFGHEKGAFTGADRRVPGTFERAHRGTLLLDEISEMRLDLQSKLLRVLQEQEFERVGGTQAVKVDVRVIATTNRDLRAAVEAGEFREDLYFRLSVVPILLPPLRRRVEDIPVLAQRFARLAGEEAGKVVTGISPEALELLRRYHWPGNVRELEHAVERAVILSPGPVLQADAFRGLAPGGPVAQDASRTPADVPAAGWGSPGIVTLTSLDIRDAEARLIERALEETGQNRTRAAELLGISVRTLRNKLNG
ncbi:MAG TPA: sigma-54 dependent transcriptional regulator [Longimicrobiales bacterium]|nr:sigma-54 dependent transcriptional regulator [Longimicrobiales bacterium]